MYHDYWAAHPLYWLSLLSSICTCSMGAVDCLVFSLRERPWRHIPSSDGTFLGSFNFWRTIPIKANGALIRPHHGPSQMSQLRFPEANPETPHVEREGGWKSNVARVGRSVRTSGSSEQAVGQAKMARTRLELEKEERRTAGYWSARERRKSTILDIIEGPEHEAREVRFAEGGVEELDCAGAEDYARDGGQRARGEVEAEMGAEVDGEINERFNAEEVQMTRSASI
jgi:G protein-coupled receptor GPR1